MPMSRSCSSTSSSTSSTTCASSAVCSTVPMHRLSSAPESRLAFEDLADNVAVPAFVSGRGCREHRSVRPQQGGRCRVRPQPGGAARRPSARCADRRYRPAGHCRCRSAAGADRRVRVERHAAHRREPHRRGRRQHGLVDVARRAPRHQPALCRRVPRQRPAARLGEPRGERHRQRRRRLRAGAPGPPQPDGAATTATRCSRPPARCNGARRRASSVRWP